MNDFCFKQVLEGLGCAPLPKPPLPHPSLPGGGGVGKKVSCYQCLTNSLTIFPLSFHLGKSYKVMGIVKMISKREIALIFYQIPSTYS